MPLLESLLAPEPLKLVLFDLDGTLVDSATDLHAAVNLMRTELGFSECTLDEVRSWVGNGARVLVERALQDLKEPLEEIMPIAFTLFLKHYENSNGRYSQCYPGAREVLAQLKDKHIRTGIVTNKPEQFTRTLLQRLDLEADLVISGDSLPQKKPSPEPLRYCMDKLKASNRQTVMVGDSISDISAARAARIPVVAVSYGYNHGQPISASNPDLIIDSLLELG